MAGKRGFTLVELLVVIAVIALIAALLFPVFSQVREKARQASCLSNVRQIGTAMMMYIADYDGGLLPNGTLTGLPGQPDAPDPWSRMTSVRIWPQLLQPYVKNYQVFFCPSFNERVLVENAALLTCDGPGSRDWFPARVYYAHYGLANGSTGGECTAKFPRSRDTGTNAKRTDKWIALAQVVRPAETAVIQDNFMAEMSNGLLGWAFGCEGGFRGAGQSRHHLGCNYIFLDGHAKLMNYDIRYEPTIECPGALNPNTSTSVPNCLCTKYTTYDY